MLFPYCISSSKSGDVKSQNTSRKQYQLSLPFPFMKRHGIEVKQKTEIKYVGFTLNQIYSRRRENERKRKLFGKKLKPQQRQQVRRRVSGLNFSGPLLLSWFLVANILVGTCFSRMSRRRRLRVRSTRASIHYTQLNGSGF